MSPDPVPNPVSLGSPPLNILMVTDFYWPLLGGVEQHVRTLSHELVRMGHRVSVATLETGGSPPSEVDHGVEVCRLRSGTQRLPRLFDQARPWAPPVADPVATRALRHIIDDVAPDLVHGHDWLSRSIPRRTSPLVSSLHYYTLTCAKKDLLLDGAPCPGPRPRRCLSCAADHYGTAKGAITAAAAAMGRRREQRATDHFIAVSTATAVGNGLVVTGLEGDLPPDQRARCSVIPNFLPARPADDGDVGGFLDRLPDAGFFAYVGDFRATKGFDLLLDAYRRLDTRRPLVVVGKRWPESPTELPDGVHLFEQWPNDAVRAMFARAAVAIVPSLWAEPFGLVAIEAMEQATPVIAAGHGGLVDIVDDGRTGLLFEPGSCADLMRAMATLDRDPALVHQLGEAAGEAALRFRAERVVPSIVDVYRAVLNQVR